MTKDKIDELVDRLCGYNPHDRTIDSQLQIAIDISDAALALQSQQADLNVAKEILKDLGKISVPVELYRLSVVAKRAKKLLKKMAGE